MADRTGQRLDNYLLMRLLGSGSYGEVYLAEHVYRKTQVAVKVLPQLAEHDLQGFLNEARTFRLKHPHIVPVIDFGVENRIPFIVMEYAPHGTLRQRYPKGARVPLATIVSYVRQIADALQYAHTEKLIHRDVKPENMLLGPNNEVLLSDFGIATMAHSSRSQSIQEMAGTVAYMAPEQIQGKPVLASDQYALGIIVYEWLCGERPFNGSPMEIATQHMLAPVPPLHEKVVDIPPAIEEVVMTILAKDLNKRFASVQAFANALEQAYKTLYPRPAVMPATQQPSVPATPSVRQLPISTDSASFNVPVSSPPLSTSANPLTTENLTPSMPVPSVSQSVTARSLPNSIVAKAPQPQPIVQQPIRKRRRLFYLLLVLLVLSILSGLGGTYYYSLQAENQNLQQALDYAQEHIVKATNEVSTSPALALSDLSSAQKRLRDVQTNHQLNKSQNTRFESLQQQLATEARVAIASYNTAAAIELLPCANTMLNAVNGGSTNTIAKSIVAVQTPKMTSLLYSLGGDGTLYRLNQDGTQYTLVNGFALPKGAQLTTIAGNGRFLLALESQGTLPATYSLNVFPPPDLSGKLGTPSTVTIPAELITDGKTPTFLTAWGPSVSVILSSSADPHNAVVLSYTLDLRNNHVVGTVLRTPIAISEDIVSVAAFPKQLFLLLADGSVSSLQLVGKNPAPVPVQVTPPIATPLAGDDQPFTATMNVPTGTTNVSTPTTGQDAVTFLKVPGASLLTAGQVNSIPHLYIVHPATHRVIDLQPPNTSGATPSPPATSTVAETSLTLQFMQQYVSSSSLSQVKSLAVDPLGTHLFVLVQNNSALWNIVSTSTGPQSGCKS